MSKTIPNAAPDEAALLEPLSPFGIDLAEAARLGARAEGVEIVTVAPPAGSVGLPEAVPVVLTRGEHPGAADMSRILEAYRRFPARKKGTAVAQTLATFCALVNRHKTEHSAVFADADWRKPSFTAVIDYHPCDGAGRADNGQHRIRYEFPLSDEWKTWIAADGQKMDQLEFAAFLEDRIAELASPDEDERIWLERDFATTIATPSEMIQLSRGLQVHVASRVKGAHTLSSGEGQIVWEESHQDADGRPLRVPGIFILSIAPFFMGEKMRVPVRLRYRVVNGSVIWLFQIYRPDQHVTEHVRRALFDAAKETGLPTYEGQPEMTASA